MKEEHRSNLHTFCLVLCTTTFMVYTYLYKQDVNIKRRMLNNYDIISTEDVSTNTISTIKLDIEDEKSIENFINFKPNIIFFLR